MIRSNHTGKNGPRFAIAIAAYLALLMSGSQGIGEGLPRGTATDRFNAVQLKIAKLLKKTGATGVAVAVAKDGKIIWEQGFGFTGRDQRTAVTPETMFSLASITKPMTMTGLMTLVERGLIDLDKPANDYLGTAKLTACAGNASTAAVKNLIYHTAGLPMHWDFFYADSPLPPPDMEESIRRYGILTAAPGEGYTYSNFGYGILGHIIARLSKKSYADFMKQEVFEPLGMSRSAILTTSPLPENTALKYDPAKREVAIADFDHQGASAAYASVRDLIRFGMFHLGNTVPGQKQILKRTTLARMHRESGSEFKDGNRLVKCLLAMFAQVDYRGYRFLTATGGMPGAVSRLDFIPSENIASAVLANADGIDLWDLQNEIFAALLSAYSNSPDQSRKAPEASAAGKFYPPDLLVGRWTGTIRTYLKILPASLTFARDGSLLLEIDGKKYSPLPAKTELGDINYTDGVFSGVFWGKIDTPDTARQSHVVYISVRLRKDSLSGSASAVSIDARRTFCLPHCLELSRSR